MAALENVLDFMGTVSYFENPERANTPEDYEEYMKKIKEVRVILPDELQRIQKEQDGASPKTAVECAITCDDADSYTMAARLNEEYNLSENEDTPRCLVLNFANPYHPGGGVRRGANAQEESLCRQSSLLFSLESEEAASYYLYNKENKNKDAYGNDYGTDAMLLTPYVEIIKSRNRQPLPVCEKTAVLTAAAPIISDKENISVNYKELFSRRIYSVLLCAAHYGYRHLVLGAWGCGAFGNNPVVVARLFYDEMERFTYGGKSTKELFERISFAVPYSENRPINYLTFKTQFEE